MSYWAFLLLPLAFAAGAPMLIWAMECAAALLLPARPQPRGTGRRPSLTVLVPAHNEAPGIGRSLDSLKTQLEAGDTIVVVADNCTDATANVARECGAIVLERCDPARRGKSYALEFGIASLPEPLPDVVVVVDADCTAQSSALSRLAQMAFITGRPVQASYYLEAPSAPGVHQTTALAFLIKNVVRPSGLSRLGFPCFLNGSGMAFPSGIVRSVTWANGRLAEDRWTTVDLALAGHVPAFCEESRIGSSLPHQTRALRTQQMRWMHGTMDCMLRQGPRLLGHAIRRGSLALLVLALDLLVPPFSLMIGIWLLSLGITVLAGFVGAGRIPAALLLFCGLLIAILTVAVESRFGGRGAWKLMAAAPRFFLSRTPILAAFLLHRQHEWIPTARDAGETKDVREAGCGPD
jgi:cellulose synthase/poly-beta-1,6-N-acetylglucosamine synthase-like glycosyltransferase